MPKKKLDAAPKVAAASPKVDLRDDLLQLKQWCIENAMKWPVQTSSVYQASSYGGGGLPTSCVTYAPVIENAQKLFDWVTKSP